MAQLESGMPDMSVWGLELRPSPTKGNARGVFTTKAFKRGDVVFWGPATAALVLPADRQTRCNVCTTLFANKQDAKQCSGCKQMVYCSRECQMADWATGHRFLCKDDSLRSDPDVEMLFRTALIPLLGSTASQPVRLAARVFASLEHHTDTADKQLIAEYTRIAEFVRAKLIDAAHKLKAPTSLVPSVTRLVQDLGRFGCNNFEIYDDELFTFGMGVYPFGALLNHECHPNCLALYRHKDTEPIRQEIRVLCDVPIGTELTLTYLDAVTSNEARREITRSKYGFECRCSRCTDKAWFDWHMDAALVKQCDGKVKSCSIEQFKMYDITGLHAHSTHPQSFRMHLDTLSPESLVALLHKQMNLAEGPQYDICKWRVNRLCESCTSLMNDARNLYAQALELPVNQFRLRLLTAAMRAQLKTLHPLNRAHISVANDFIQTVEALTTETEARTDAFYAAIHIAIIYTFAYQPNHPLIGLQLFKAAQLAVTAALPYHAYLCVLEARGILQNLHPGNSEIALAVITLEAQLATQVEKLELVRKQQPDAK